MDAKQLIGKIEAVCLGYVPTNYEVLLRIDGVDTEFDVMVIDDGDGCGLLRIVPEPTEQHMFPEEDNEPRTT